MLKTASKPVDVQDLHFKLQCRLDIFDKQQGNVSKTSQNLLASASRYGLIFVGCASAKLKVLAFESIESNSSSEATKNYPRRELNLNSKPYHICVNCDHTILAVVVQKDNCLSALFYDVLSFYKENIVLLNEVRLTSTPGLEVLQANWHPTLNNIFTECNSDGTLGIYELKDKSFDVKKLPAESKACCFCWSPKGKQIAVGSKDGKIIHYKPDLKAVKSIDAPPLEKPHSVLSLQWISNYQFVGVFKMSDESDPECRVVLIDAPKTGNPTFTNFYDICYSNGSFRPPQFYMLAEQHWNILLVASANSMEVGVLSNTGEIWTQWILPDSARAELPLDENQDETFPIGMTIDTSSDKPVLWGESYIQPAPSLILLSHEGVLCCFKMINLKEGAPSVNSPVEKIGDMSGLRHFVTPSPEAVQVSKPHGQESTLSEKKEASPANSVAPPAQTNPPGLSSLLSPTPTGAPTVPSSQGQQTPTTPLSIFKTTTPKQQFPSLATNLFGGQISITPVKSNEATQPSSAASTGASLLSNILSGSSALKKEDAPAPPMGSMPFSSFLGGSVAGQSSITPQGKQMGTLGTPSAAGSGTLNRSTGSGQVQTGSLQGTGSIVHPSSGSGQVQTGSLHGTGFTLSSPSGSGQVQTGSLQGSGSTTGSGQMQTASLHGTSFTLPSPTGSGQVQTGSLQGTGFTVPSSTGSGQVQTSGLHGTSFTVASLIGGGQVQTGNTSGASGTLTQNTQGPQKTDTKPNVLSTASNTTKAQAPVKIDKNIEEKESEDIKNMLTKMILMECSVLDKEIKDLVIQGQHLKIPLKSDEMDRIVQNTEDIKEFLKELVETCEIQSSEVHILKQNTIQSWAWVEEARSRYKESQDEELRSLMKSKPLDSVSEKHLTTLKQMKYYLDSQLRQSHKALDDQWDKFQDYCRKNNRMQLPTMEAIFQTMVKQNAVLQRHNYILKDITSQIKGKQKASNKAALFNPPDRNDSLDASFQNLKLEPENINSIYYQKVLNRVKSVPPNKTNQLRRILHNREVPHVMAKSQLSTSALNSSLRTSQQMSTTLKTPSGKRDNSQLYQSTPLNLTPELAPQISSTPFSAFAPTSNLVPKPQVSTRFWTVSHHTETPVSSNFNKENSSTQLSLSGDKQPVVPQSQNALYKTSTASTNEKVGYNAFSNFGFNQDGSQNMFGTNRNTSSFLSNSLTASTKSPNQKLATSEASVSTTLQASKQFSPLNPSISSSNSNLVTTTPQSVKSTNVFGPSTNFSAATSQTGAPIKIFSFASSPSQSKELPSSTAVTSVSTFSFSTPSISMGSSVGGTVPTNTSSSSFFNSASNKVSGFGKSGPGGNAGLFDSSPSFTVVGNSSSNKDSASIPTSLPGNSVKTTTGSIFGSSASNDAALPVGGVSKTMSSKASNEAVPESAASATSSTPSGDNTTSSKPLFTSNLTSSGPKAAVSIFSVPVSSDSVPTTSISLFGTSKKEGGQNSASSTFHFGISPTSSGSVQTTTSSILSLSLNKQSSSDSKSIFGTTATTTGEVSSSSKSIFGSVTSTTGEAPSSGKSIFATTPSSTGEEPSNSNSIFGTSTSTGEVSSSKSLFSATVSSKETGSAGSFSFFGNSAVVTEKSSTMPGEVSKSIFNTVPTTSPSIFGVTAAVGESTSNASKSIFSNSATTSAPVTSGSSVTATSKSIFGTSVTSSAATVKTPDTKNDTVQTSTKSIFNTSAANNGAMPTSAPSIFGTTSGSGAVPANAQSIFGASVTSSGTASTTSSSIFGSSASGDGPLSLTTKSIFAAAANSGSTSTTPPIANSQASPFGAASFGANNAPTGSIFGNAASTTSPFGSTTGKSVFGSAPPASSVFGASAPVSSSPFSATPFASVTSSSSVFGQATPTTSPFSTAAVATSPFSGTANNAQSPFGATPSTADSPFGAVAPPVCSPFGAQGFGTGFNANTTVQSSPFGQVSTPSNVFGSNSNSTSASAFGTVSSTENPSSPFGQSSGGMFGSFGAAASPKPAEGSFGFGSLNVGTTSQSPFSKQNENKSPFGAATFNPTTSSGSLFGSSSFGNNNGNSVFRQSAFGGNSAFSSTQQSGPFSGGSGSIAQTGFGIQSPQQPPAFGASPSFGGTPAFGSAPTFGGAPAFGSTPSFGSPNKVFGSPNPASAGSAFGSSSTQQSSGFGSFSGFGNMGQQQNNPGVNSTQGSGFGSFATQSTIGFGNLAQQTNNAGQNAPFSGTSSFSSWR